MKLAVLIPDRRDRPQFLENCIRMMNAQTLKPDHIELVNDPPLNDKCDITYRYRIGYDRLRNKGFDLIALIENDDWYHPDYFKLMVNAWYNCGKPQLLGTNYTIYYHIGVKGWFRMGHATRSSAMNTFIIPDLNFQWCKDEEPYTDMHLWDNLKGIVVRPEKHISLGIKHGLGLCGGAFHVTMTERFNNVDTSLEFLASVMDNESFTFYKNLTTMNRYQVTCNSVAGYGGQQYRRGAIILENQLIKGSVSLLEVRGSIKGLPENSSFPTVYEVQPKAIQNGRNNKVIVSSGNVEFGYELISALTYAYSEYKQGRLQETRSAIDTECFYFFSPKHTIDHRPRNWDNMKGAANIPNIWIHQSSLDWSKFEAPPLKDHYKNDRFVFDKPIICICNRVNVEWGRSVINYFDKDCLEKLFKSLHEKYIIVYFNIEGKTEFYDGADPVSIDEWSLVKKYALNIHDLHSENRDLSFNTLQLMIMANCSAFITMNGGYCILASYFGGTNIIYSKECREITPRVNSFYRWYHKFGDSRIIHVDNYKDLHNRVHDVFVAKKPLINLIIRSHNRPKHFEQTYNSVVRQSYKNVNIIAGADNNETERYLIPYKCRQIRYSPMKDVPQPKPGYGAYFPHNFYTNILKDEVKEGWFMGLDDDDMFMEPKALEIIVSHITSEDDLLLWRVNFNGVLVPSDKNFGGPPVAKDISGIGYMCHIKHLGGKIFTPYRRADHRLIAHLYEKLNPVWINEGLTGPQNGKCNYGEAILN